MRFGTQTVAAFKRGRRVRTPEGFKAEYYEGGFQVVLSVMDCGDGMFQEIVHPAVFKTEAGAKALLARIQRNRMDLNLNNWIIGNHPCDAWQRDPEKNPALYCPLPIPF